MLESTYHLFNSHDCVRFDLEHCLDSGRIFKKIKRLILL